MQMRKTLQGRKKLSQITATNPKGKTIPTTPQAPPKSAHTPEWEEVKQFIEGVGLGEYLPVLSSNGLDEMAVLRGTSVHNLRQNRQSLKR